MTDRVGPRYPILGYFHGCMDPLSRRPRTMYIRKQNPVTNIVFVLTLKLLSRDFYRTFFQGVLPRGGPSVGHVLWLTLFRLLFDSRPT